MAATLAEGRGDPPPHGGSKPVRRPLLWFEALYGRLGIPLWAGAVVVTYLPFLLGLVLGYAAAGVWDEFKREIPFVHLPVFVSFVAFQLGAVYVCDRIERLHAYAESMVEGPQRTHFARLYRVGPILVISAIFVVFSSVAYRLSFGPGYTLSQVLLVQVSTWPILDVFLCTLFWVWGYSMHAIYRMAKMPLKLGAFTEDRMLGLAPFAKESLRLTVIYLVLVAVISFPQILSGAFGPLVAVMFLSFFPLGMGFFLLPLIPLRSKLRRAKAEKMRWIGAEYSKILGSVGAIGGMDETTAARLMVIDKIQRDIKQIPTWPLEAGILARLVGIVVTVTAILVATIVRLAIGI